MGKKHFHLVCSGLLVCITSCNTHAVHPAPVDENMDAASTPQINDIDRSRYADLFIQADQAGTVRVIVELSMQSNGDSSTNSVTEAQDRLIRELSNFQYKLVRRYTSLPILTIEIGRDALEYLIHSPHVKSIHPDTLHRPMINK
jgi:hypothetical protein